MSQFTLANVKDRIGSELGVSGWYFSCPNRKIRRSWLSASLKRNDLHTDRFSGAI
jgi:hypothetical protein